MSPSVAKKLSLPLFDDITRAAGAAPTLARARQKLGGTGTTDARAGTPVRDGTGAIGIVLYAAGDELDVLVGSGGVVRRSTVAQWSTVEAVPSELSTVADSVARFARLREGDRVGFTLPASRGSNRGEGLLFEKCRYGALVARDDRSIVAVGYKSLAAVPMESRLS